MGKKEDGADFVISKRQEKTSSGERGVYLSGVSAMTDHVKRDRSESRL